MFFFLLFSYFYFREPHVKNAPSAWWVKAGEELEVVHLPSNTPRQGCSGRRLNFYLRQRGYGFGSVFLSFFFCLSVLLAGLRKMSVFLRKVTIGEEMDYSALAEVCGL